MKHALRTVALAVLFGAAVQAAAQSQPSKPVKLIVSQAAGGAPDIVARLVSDRLSRMWGQQVVVDNRPGAGGGARDDPVFHRAGGRALAGEPL